MLLKKTEQSFFGTFNIRTANHVELKASRKLLT